MCAYPPEASHINAIEELQSSSLNDIGLVFFLNGHGPRASYPNGRSVNVTFLLNGGIETTQRVLYTTRANRSELLWLSRPTCTESTMRCSFFLNKFPQLIGTSIHIQVSLSHLALR